MKFKIALAATLAAGLIGAQSARAVEVNFDSQSPGTDANLSAPAGWSFSFGVFDTDYDPVTFDPVGSSYWHVDSGVVTADNPNSFGYGNAPSPGNALNATGGPVLLSFGTPLDIQHFSATLDDSTFGDLGPRDIEFFGLDHALLGKLTLDQTIPGFTATFDGKFAQPVGSILLPSTAFYDDINVKVPDAGASAALLLIGLGSLRALKRHN